MHNLCPSQPRARRLPRWAVSLALVPVMAFVMAPVMAQTQLLARELVCQMRYASETFVLRQAAGPDPYAAVTVDVPGRFRLRAVVLGTPEHIEHITLSTYELGEDVSPLILQQVRLSGPFAPQQAIPDLTGWQHVYASYLGREMRFGCALLPVADPGTEPAMQVPR